MARRQLKDKRIILTGASSGIGRCLAERLIDVDARLVITARRKSLLDALIQQKQASPDRCIAIGGDITEAGIQNRIVAAVKERWGGVDCVINNAGITALGRFDSATDDRMRKVFDVNFFAMTALLRLALPELKQGEDPLIVNIGSVLGHRAVPLKNEYCASKFAVHGFTDSLRAELVRDGVDVLLVSPSTVKSQLFDAAVEDSSGRIWETNNGMEPDYVARRIIAAMIRRKDELILPAAGKALVWLDRLFPAIANRLVSRYGQ